MSRLVAAALVCASAFVSSPAAAQIENNDYAIDLFQGPVLAPIRVISMGGAYAGYAEGIAGFVANAASPSVRHTHSTGWWEGDLDASISVPIPLFENNDFDNSGETDQDYSDHIYLSGGLQLQAGPFGIGAFGDLQRYDLEGSVVVVGRYHLLAAWGFLGDQLHLGGGPRALTLGISAPDADITFVGISPQFGMVVKPDWTPFRFGATYRHPVSASTSTDGGTNVVDGIRRAGQDLIMPDRVELPWEVELGVAVQVGPRPLNPKWIHPDEHEAELRDAYAARRAAREQRINRQLNALPPGETRKALERQLRNEQARIDAQQRRQRDRDLERLRDERRARARNWPREALLLTLDLLVTGPVEQGQSLERFLAQSDPAPRVGDCAVVASGEEVNFSPRLGLEMEPFIGWMHTRFGTYYEPNRFRYDTAQCNDRVGRQHFTFGADVKLASTTWFGLVPEVTYKLQAYGDLAPRYQSFGAGFGVWY